MNDLTMTEQIKIELNDEEIDEGLNADADADDDSRFSSSENSCSESDDDSGLKGIASRLWANDSNSSDEGESLHGNKNVVKSTQEEEEERNFMSLHPDYAWEKLKESQVFLEPPVKQIPSPASGKNSCKDYVRFVFISDTHAKHRDITHLPKGDVLVHGGDFTKSGEIGTIQDLSEYFGELADGSDTANFQQVICIAGNHDLTLDPEYYDENWQRFHNVQKFDTTQAARHIRKHCVYLHDESHMLELPNKTNKRLHVWGSPYSPKFWDWAFNKDRGSDIRDIWDTIPSDGPPVDVLITHGPPIGRGDLVLLGQPRRPTKHGKTTTRAGCYDLLLAIQNKIKPKINVFGHIHEDYGVTYDGTTLYVNASSVNKQYEAVRLPIVIDVPLGKDGDDCAMVVKPTSLIRSSKMQSLEEWIAWCRRHQHTCVADALAQNFPRYTAREWFAGKEPPPDRFLEELEGILAYSHERPTREFRRHLASMVYHLFALAFEDQ